jgi:RimJ/RimL family protein N-acetyltransferase
MAIAERKRELVGLGIELRSVTVNDVDFILELRARETSRTSYINPVSLSVPDQKEWILKQQQKIGDYYFVIVNRFTGEPEGLIGLYDVADGVAEWGRWVVRPSSLAAVESVLLLMSFSFEALGLQKLYSRTVEENSAVVKFHDSYAQRAPSSVPFVTELRGVNFPTVEHQITAVEFNVNVKRKWKVLQNRLFDRQIRAELGAFDFHHLGIATKSINEARHGFELLGYQEEASFSDDKQGVKGLFMTSKNQPRIELLENLSGSNVLNSWLKHSVAV